MGYVQIVEMDENGVTVTDLSEASDSLRLELWLDLIQREQEMRNK